MRHLPLLSALLFLSLGCGSASPPAGRSYSDVKSEQIGAIPPKPTAPAGEAAPPPTDAVPRKIIYTAEAHIIVQEFEPAEEQLLQLIKDHKGYLAQSETGGTTGSPRSGRWKVRIPVEQFEDFLAAVARLGVPRKISRDSKDVTEEFYDLEARLKAKKIEETRLLKHLESSTGKLEDILAVERELTRVRGEIEQQEGRLRLLANLAALTTVTVHFQEIKDYVPPQAPTFGAEVSSTFSDSLGALGRFGKGLVIGAVALAPWLPIVAMAAAPLWFVGRGYWRRGGGGSTATSAGPRGLRPTE